MEQEFVTYEKSLELKELGFDEPCLAAYNCSDNNKFMIACQLYSYKINTGRNSDVSNIIKATSPTYSQAFRWFRNTHNLHFIICKNISIDGYGYREVIQIEYSEEIIETTFKTYEEAELECLKKLIEIVKQNKNG